MAFGISTHLYHDARLDRDHLVEIAAHGFEVIEVFATRTHFDYHDPSAIEGLVGHLRDAGLRVHSMHAPIAESLRDGVWGPPLSIASAVEADRRRAVAEIMTAARAAQQLEARFLVVHVGAPDDMVHVTGENVVSSAARSLQEISDGISALGVDMALEVIPNALSTAERLVHWLDEDLELPGAGICLDSGHAHLMEGVVDAIETASGHLLTTHLHDNGGRRDDHQVPFEGSIQWPAALTAFQKVGYDDAWMFELAAGDTPRRVLERAAKARERFERLLQG